MLEQIETKLKEVCNTVFYGVADDLGNVALWNYIVFRREKIRRSESNNGFSDYYTVGIVHENYVPDEMIDAVIAAMESLPGMRLANSDVEFDYTRKPGTNAVIEVASVTFVRPKKKKV